MDRVLHTFAVCAYGDSPYLEQCVRSLTRQTVRSEIIICTATPSDYICRIAEKYGICLYARDGEPGIREDWQYAWEKSGGLLVTIAHQDDIYRRTYTEELIRAYGKYPDLSLFASDYMTIKMKNGKAVDDTFNTVWLVKKILRLPLRLQLISDRTWLKLSGLVFGNSICCPTCTYNKALIGDREMFPSEMKFALDWDNLVDLASAAGRFVITEKPLLAYRVHDGAATFRSMQDDGRNWEEEAMFRKLWPESIADLLMKLYKKAGNEYR
ncbi:MAG: glycosyltransferase family A protein [[Clostridium] aminophilum]|uniref:glycosyltransferase family A protein n=1 Tax=[Clostridium] aminophilum TaxID=1526 RepID=UPI0026F1E22D|nr:glycosyltransferase family A protein [[Clostridium] aminophilum]MDD6196692.1 glycosyltransferase family A protein [[Clostridium] aminophilum]